MWKGAWSSIDAYGNTLRSFAPSYVLQIKEENFYKYFISKIDYFNELLLQYINDKTIENRDKVLGELGVDREFLGFKYWIIKDNNVEEFYDDIVWNKR